MKMASNSFLSWRRIGETDSDDSDTDIIEGSFIDKQKECIVVDSSDASDDSIVNIRKNKKTRALLEDCYSETDEDDKEGNIDVKEGPHKIITDEDNINSLQSTICEDTNDYEGSNFYDENVKIQKSNSSVYKNNNLSTLVNNSFENNNDHKYSKGEERSYDENENTSNVSSKILKNYCEIVNESSSFDNLATSSAVTKMLTTENNNTSVNGNETIDAEAFKPECVKTYASPQSEPNAETNSVKFQSFASSSNNSKFNIAQNSNEDIENLKAEKIRLEYEIKSINELIRNYTITLNTVNMNILPDKGMKIKVSLARKKRNLNELLEQLKKVNNKLSFLSIDDSNSSNNHNKKVNLPKIGTLPSANIQEMGKRALETYRVQQSLTIDSLREFHNSLKSCPSEDKVIPDPEGLKLSLMDHQKQALVWLLWREKEKPSGGILADDMGLGKTLTMISLILKKENDSENDSGSSDSEEEDNDDDDSDITKRNRCKGGTLIVCPASLIGQWELEIKRRVKQHFLTYEIYHGQSREKKPRRLAKQNIIITSYAIVRVEMGKSNKNLLNVDTVGPLFKVNWKRIILDEAHNIKNHKSQTASAVFNLKAKYRWALTGTPVHNKTQDFFSLIKFLRCKPFDDFEVWKKWVEAKDETGTKRLNMLTKSLMLRRTKNILMSEGKLASLPEKLSMDVSVSLNKDELSLYEKVSQFSKTLLYQLLYQKAEKEQLLNNGIQVSRNYKNANFNEDNPFSKHPALDKLYKRVTSMNNVKTHEILVLLLRLRQICCHPALMKSMIEKDGMIQDGIHDVDGSDIDLLEKMSSMTVNDSDRESGSYESEEKIDVFNTNHQIFKPDWPSSKIQAILRLLEEILLETDDKIVVVSQWSSMLELLYNFIKKFKNCKCDLFTGKVPVDQRMNIVNEFNDNLSKLKILLLSLTAGATGLNLAGANHLILTDLHWNPQLEAQACDRIYRVGQNKPVKIYKFICTETIEERIQELQRNKLALAEGVLSGSKQLQIGKLSLNDLKMLFNVT
ncbi:transcription termination factor lodestar [Lycorma delicatula]|uniref:transcription termination factor lodestar n=1 Tax=Lycorma delicatula TaxID=130591 RepID=UPI003F511FC5